MTGPVADVERADGGRGTRRTLVVALLALLLALGVVVAVALTRQADVADSATPDTPPLLPADGPAVDAPLPDATLPPLAGFGPPGGLALPETGGEPMLINFWASWCAPCVNEMPMLQRVTEDVGLRMVGVDYVDQLDKAVELVERLDIRYTLVRDDRGAFGEEVGLLGTPTTLLVDGDGVVRRRLTGELTEDQLRTAIAEELGSG